MTTISAAHLPIPSDRSDRRRTASWVVVGVILFAVIVRLYHLDHSSLMHGEAVRALDAWSAPLERMRWFPPLHYAMLWCVRHCIGSSEFIVRLPSALGGCGCVLLLFLFTKKHIGTSSAICVAAVSAVHPELILFSRLLKEFSLEALMCVAVTWTGYEASRDPSRRRLVVFLLCGVLSFGLTYTAPLVVAAWLAVLAWLWLRSQPADRAPASHLVTLLIVFAVVFGLWYAWLSGAEVRVGASTTYGKNQGAWPVVYTAPALVEWLRAQSYGALLYVLGTRPLYPPIDTLIGSFELLAIGASLGVLWKKVPAVCVAITITLLLTVFAGALRLWPFGNFHTLLFLVPLVCLAMGCGLAHLVRRLGVYSIPAVMLLLVCVGNPGARAFKHTVVYPDELEHVRPALSYIEEHAQENDGLFVYYAAGWAVEYYWKGRWQGQPYQERSWQHNDIDVLIQPTSDRDDFSAFKARFDGFMARRQSTWIIFTHDWKNERQEWVDYLQRQYTRVDEHRVADVYTILLKAECASVVRADGVLSGDEH